MNFINDFNRQNILLIDNYCGGGHVEAAIRVQEQIKEDSFRENYITKIEILTNSFGRFFGTLLSSVYNINQKIENIRLMNFVLTKFHQLGNILAAPPVFFSTLYSLRKNKIDIVINVQPVAISSIVKAVRMLNFINRHFFRKEKTINVYTILTELPTKDTSDFFKSIKSLNKNDRKIFKLVTTAPLCDSDETIEEFWKNKTGLSKENIIYDNLPIRKPFNVIDKNVTRLVEKLQVRINPKEESIIQTCSGNRLNRTNFSYLFELNIKKEDKILTITLGSQTSYQATINYVESILKWAQTSLTKSSETHYVFVFCGRNQYLLETISELIIENKEIIPSSLVIIPLGYQSAEQVAPIFARSDFLFHRTGGLTAMEVNEVATGQLFVHVVDSKSKAQIDEHGNICNEEELLKKGMLPWEKGNYHYLKKKKGARIITPALVKYALKKR